MRALSLKPQTKEAKGLQKMNLKETNQISGKEELNHEKQHRH